MKSALIFLFLLACFPQAFAKKNVAALSKKSAPRKPAQVSTQSPQAKVFLRYLTCQNHMVSESEAAKIGSCVSAEVVTSPSRRQELINWIYMRVLVTEVRDCTEREVASANGFPDVTPHTVCFVHIDNGQPRLGIAFFQKAGANFRLYSLYQAAR